MAAKSAVGGPLNPANAGRAYMFTPCPRHDRTQLFLVAAQPGRPDEVTLECPLCGVPLGQYKAVAAA